MAKTVKEVMGKKEGASQPVKDALGIAGKNSSKLKSLKIKLKFKE
jgi:hypothetical protein